MISSEINEILGVTDRTLVVRDGKIVGRLKTSETTEEQIDLLRYYGRDRRG
ncbi:MAG: hypothetical protein ACLTBV_13100 [Enterocloster bolteae]